MSEGPIVIVSPATASSNNGNWQTASRWQAFLATKGRVEVLQQWSGEPAAAMVALHARRSADSIARFRQAHPQRPLALVLTGTDVYGDINSDSVERHALRCATHVVVLQEEALNRLTQTDRAKARVIVQSAPPLLCSAVLTPRLQFVAVGHLRQVKDPLTLMKAARLLRDTEMPIIHIGEALDPTLGAEAQRTMRDCPNYRWLGGLPQAVARQRIACAQALVHMSLVEGGANVVIEAVCSRVPVLASRIDGNVGLLGHDYEGYFAAGDADELSRLMRRVHDEPSWASRLRAQCALREPLFAPAAEEAALQRLLADMLRGQRLV